VLHFRAASVNTKLYPDRDALFAALAGVYRQAVRSFYDAGCRYLQFDDTAWAYLCSKDEVQKAKQRGTEVENLPQAYAHMINRVLEAKPRDMVITTHICRGNFRSTWITSGGYEPVAEVLFGAVNYDGYFLEYDSDRAGGFEPLRFVPKGSKQITQLRFNVPNVPIFVNNTSSFLGDYLDAAAQSIVPSGNPGQPYKFSTSATDKPVFHVTWTDNRDVVPPLKSSAAWQHTPSAIFVF
jgi:hypothetical protein